MAKKEAGKPKLVVESVAIIELKKDPRNARLHPERNLEAIRASLERFGQQKPIVVDKDGVVIAGNGTMEAALQLGWTHIDAVRTELEGKDATAFAIADNRTAELAEWDIDVLMSSIAHIGDGESLGFSAQDIDSLQEVLNAASKLETDEDEAKYSSKIESPVYTPKLDHQPELSSLVSTTHAEKLSERISASDLPADVKSFLLAAATRHYRFDYGMIAEFYSHADKATQELMEESALVIIDFDKAIELGFVTMTEAMSAIVAPVDNGVLDEIED